VKTNCKGLARIASSELLSPPFGAASAGSRTALIWLTGRQSSSVSRRWTLSRVKSPMIHAVSRNIARPATDIRHSLEVFCLPLAMWAQRPRSRHAFAAKRHAVRLGDAVEPIHRLQKRMQIVGPRRAVWPVLPHSRCRFGDRPEVQHGHR
jgi:hypothetical protein